MYAISILGLFGSKFVLGHGLTYIREAESSTENNSSSILEQDYGVTV